METTQLCRCGHRLTVLDTHLPDHVVTMRSCSPCDQRAWLLDGEPVPAGRAITLIGRSWSSVRSSRAAA